MIYQTGRELVTAVRVCRIDAMEHGVAGTLTNLAPLLLFALPASTRLGEVRATHAPDVGFRDPGTVAGRFGEFRIIVETRRGAPLTLEVSSESPLRILGTPRGVGAGQKLCFLQLKT